MVESENNPPPPETEGAGAPEPAPESDLGPAPQPEFPTQEEIETQAAADAAALQAQRQEMGLEPETPPEPRPAPPAAEISLEQQQAQLMEQIQAVRQQSFDGQGNEAELNQQLEQLTSQLEQVNQQLTGQEAVEPAETGPILSEEELRQIEQEQAATPEEDEKEEEPNVVYGRETEEVITPEVLPPEPQVTDIEKPPVEAKEPQTIDVTSEAVSETQEAGAGAPPEKSFEQEVEGLKLAWGKAEDRVEELKEAHYQALKAGAAPEVIAQLEQKVIVANATAKERYEQYRQADEKIKNSKLSTKTVGGEQTDKNKELEVFSPKTEAGGGEAGPPAPPERGGPPQGPEGGLPEQPPPPEGGPPQERPPQPPTPERRTPAEIAAGVAAAVGGGVVALATGGEAGRGGRSRGAAGGGGAPEKPGFFDKYPPAGLAVGGLKILWWPIKSILKLGLSLGSMIWRGGKFEYNWGVFTDIRELARKQQKEAEQEKKAA